MAKLVLDLSKFDRGINLSEWIKRRDLWGVIIKCGGHEYLTDYSIGRSIYTKYEDSAFRSFMNEAKRLGLKVGTYYYSVATTVSEVKADWKHCLEIIQGYDFDLPVYIDIEEAEQISMPASKLTPIAEEWCKNIINAGYSSGIYSGTEGFYNMNDSVCQYNLWLARWSSVKPSWASIERGYSMWQQGSMNIDGDIIYTDTTGYHDLDWWYGSESDVKPSDKSKLREQVIAYARSQLGVRYYSMHEGPRGSEVEGWGCAKLCAKALNVVLGTDYYGSCYEFAGDALGEIADGYHKHNQGGGEFVWVDDPIPGDLCIYKARGYDGRDSEDYGHIGMCVENGMVISALGSGVPGEPGYIGDPAYGWGVQEHTPEHCIDITSGSLDSYRYMRCTRFDTEPEDKEDGVDMIMLIHPKGINKIYYWNGSVESIPYHVSPSEKTAFEKTYKLTNNKSIPYIEMELKDFNALLDACKSRKDWRDNELVKKIVSETNKK